MIIDFICTWIYLQTHNDIPLTVKILANRVINFQINEWIVLII